MLVENATGDARAWSGDAVRTEGSLLLAADRLRNGPLGFEPCG
jgi:hypothetical protein